MIKRYKYRNLEHLENSNTMCWMEEDSAGRWVKWEDHTEAMKKLSRDHFELVKAALTELPTE